MPKFNDYFESKFLSSFDLNDREWSVTIDRITKEEVGREREKRPIAYFAGAKKPMVLNRTNFRTIAKTYGQDDSQWRGAEITLYPAVTEVQGEQKDCIRIKIPEQVKVSPAAPPPITSGPQGSGGSGSAPPFNDKIPFAPEWR